MKKIIPIENHLYVQLEALETKSKGGLYLSESDSIKDYHVCKVLAIPPSDEDADEDSYLVGESLILTKHFKSTKIEDNKYIISYDDVRGIYI